MDSSLRDIWQTASGSPFQPAVGKGSQFFVGFVLLLLGLGLTGGFAFVLTSPTQIDLSPASPSTVFQLDWLSPSERSTCSVLSEFTSRERERYPQKSDSWTDENVPVFSPKVDVQLTHDGIRFAADHSRVMQGVAFLDQSLFTTYTLNWPESAKTTPRFQMNLSAFLEALQIFGAADAAVKAAKTDVDSYRSNLRNYRPDAFSHQTLGMPGTCCLVYEEDGSPLSVIMEESDVKTQCNMVTYTPESPDDIPFDREDLTFKIIMQARWLLDSLSELAPLSPVRITVSALPSAPYLKLASGGATGSASVDFSNGRDLLETFSVREPWVQSFKFDLVKSASEAMRIASKVSFRGDGQGVLSLQFMVETESGLVSFLDFRFVPYITQEDEESESESDGED
ncbi:hypothetical protein E0Z10_g3080 [Xylaria hypoxylon]|uniref:DNA repair exonuclease rad1 n=1 Tax=Xylaria hypoxylon TaxID=37992 RepID=A0A4Z0YP59_9PEZI|nr:hypothetical protein E0Z10_g3080 [Xylaria hypoxylon]